MAKLKAPANAAAVHWRGGVYEVRPDGRVEVPDEAATALRSHGFVPWRGSDGAAVERKV